MSNELETLRNNLDNYFAKREEQILKEVNDLREEREMIVLKRRQLVSLLSLSGPMNRDTKTTQRDVSLTQKAGEPITIDDSVGTQPAAGTWPEICLSVIAGVSPKWVTHQCIAEKIQRTLGEKSKLTLEGVTQIVTQTMSKIRAGKFAAHGLQYRQQNNRYDYRIS